MRGGSIFLSAVTGDDHEVDAGYLAMFSVTALVAGAIPLMCVAAVVAMFIATDHHFSAQELGIGIGSVCTGLGVAIGAVGAFRAGDKPRAGVATTTTTTTASAPAVAPVTITGVTAGAVPIQAATATAGAEPMPAKIGPEDVNKTPALLEPAVKPKRKPRGR